MINLISRVFWFLVWLVVLACEIATMVLGALFSLGVVLCVFAGARLINAWACRENAVTERVDQGAVELRVVA